MEEKRYPIWYSIISYCPNSVRNEHMNVGILLGSDKDSIIFEYVNPKNKKLSSLFWNSIELEEYTSSISLLKYIISESQKHWHQPQLPQLNQGSWETFFNLESLPTGITISDVHYALGTDINTLKNNLIDIYIGKKFLQKKTDSISLKKKVYNYFETKPNITKKLKSNLKIMPVKSIPTLKIEMDYTYYSKDSHLAKFIQIAPESSSQTLLNWYKNTSMLLSRNESFDKLNILLSDQNDHSTLELKQMVADLISLDSSRTNVIYVNADISSTHSLEVLTNTVSENALLVEDWVDHAM